MTYDLKKPIKKNIPFNIGDILTVNFGPKEQLQFIVCSVTDDICMAFCNDFRAYVFFRRTFDGQQYRYSWSIGDRGTWHDL